MSGKETPISELLDEPLFVELIEALSEMKAEFCTPECVWGHTGREKAMIKAMIVLTKIEQRCMPDQKKVS